eukprot:690339-Pleurochrysis_carterae.AAC.1
MEPTHQTGTHEPELLQAVHAFHVHPLGSVQVPQATIQSSMESPLAVELGVAPTNSALTSAAME